MHIKSNSAINDDEVILSYEERINWIRLIRTTNIGAKTFCKLLDVYGTAGKALEAVPSISLRGGRSRPLNIFSRENAEKELELCEKNGARIIAKCESSYPKNLSFISDAPPVITVLGNTEIAARECVAIVGARNASANGRSIAHTFAKELGKKGYTIVSGLARGIDTSAHVGSVDTGTIAVVAGGIDIIYPLENKDLYNRIKDTGGAIIAESPVGSAPKAESFPRRNRIISGICSATLIVEAAARSGSLITARFAMEQGREVMAIPGFPSDPRAGGPNKLIKQGATLVESVDDIIDALQYNSNRKTQYMFEEDFLSEQEENIYICDDEYEIEGVRNIVESLLGSAPVEVDDIVSASSASISSVVTSLLELELAGRLERHSGNRVSLVLRKS